MTPEEELTKEQRRMLLRAIGISFAVMMLVMTLLTLIADKVLHAF